MITKENLTEKIKKSCHDCDTCEFRDLPIRIEPCKSCGDVQDNWSASEKYLKRGAEK